MSNVIAWHETATEIAFPHDNQEHVVSLLPYLQQPSEAVAVLYEIKNDSFLEEESRWLVQTGGEKVDLVHEGIMHHVDRLDGPNKEVTLLAEDSKVHVKIAAELLSPGVAIHPTKIDVSPTNSSELRTWVNRTVTLEDGDSADDVELVILATRRVDLVAGGDPHGLRGLGSTDGVYWYSIYHSCNKVYFIKAPAGQYQIYIHGKEDPFDFYTYVWEVGYARVDQGMFGILQYGFDEAGAAEDWEIRTAGSAVPDGATGMIALQQLFISDIDDPNRLRYHGARAMGSSDPAGIVPSVDLIDSCDPIKLDDQKRYEYFARHSAVGGLDPRVWILAYVLEPEVALELDLVVVEALGSRIDLVLEGMGSVVEASVRAGPVIQARCRIRRRIEAGPVVHSRIAARSRVRFEELG